MPSPLNQISPEKFALDANNRYLQNYSVRENNATLFLVNYNFNGSSPMVSHTWTTPSGDVYFLDMISGQITWNSDPFASLDADKKRLYFRYLTKFVAQCLNNYNLTYNF